MPVILRTLSDSDILSRTRDLATREREITLLLLVHLNEIERRKLYLVQGYSSLFDYCTSGLGYSESAAVRRIRTARSVARFPAVYALLEANEVNLSTITRVSRVLTAANKAALLARIRKCSQREVDAVVAEYEPRARLRDVVRPVVVRQPVLAPLPLAATTIRSAVTMGGVGPCAAHVAGAGHGAVGETTMVDDTVANHAIATSGACEKNAFRRSGGDNGPGVATEKRIQYQFSATCEFQRKLEKIRTLAWHRLAKEPSLEKVFELVMDEFIAKHDPHAKRARREKKAQALPKSIRKRHAEAKPQTATAQYVERRSRHIASAVKDEVFVRDDGRCTFTGEDGRRCPSRSALQLDHVAPFARGGASTVDNLRLLCAYHNRLESERLLGW